MSKMDNLRAMREARYAEAQKRSAAGPTKPTDRPPVAPRPSAAATAKKKSGLVVVPDPDPAAEGAETVVEADTEELCGHRNMGGRTCTRERGHSAKSHRYS
jgi:hypothetical protein